MRSKSYRIWLSLGVLCLVLALGAVGAKLWYDGRHDGLAAEWAVFNEDNVVAFDHEPWQILLEDYLETETEDGVYRVDYAGLQEEAADDLKTYIASLTANDPRGASRNEQLAYWINLYNAATVDLVVDHYPFDTITSLGETKLAFGPWDDKRVEVAGQQLSLNEIEHGILRPIFKDPRIHFGVNCASYGCPNLQPEAFTAENVQSLLDLSAREYMEHPRALQWEGDTLLMSSLFEWYGDDFGADRKSRFEALAAYCPDDMGSRLISHSGAVDYRYDWGLNDLKY